MSIWDVYSWWGILAGVVDVVFCDSSFLLSVEGGVFVSEEVGCGVH